MSNNVNNQYDFFKLVNLDNDGNLGVNVIGGGSGDNYYTTSGSYNAGTEELEFVGNNVLTTFNVDVSALVGSDINYYVTGGTYNSGTEEIDFVGNNPLTTFSVDVSSLVDTDTNYYVSGGTYNSGTEELEFVGNDVSTTFNVDVSGILTNLPYDTSFALSDETTQIVTGTSVTTIYAPRGFNLTNVKASLTTSGSSISEFDIKVNGVSILSTNITIDSNENSSSTALVPPVISSSSVSDNDRITVDIVQAGTGATGAKIYLIGETV
jgi:hypothetical protein